MDIKEAADKRARKAEWVGILIHHTGVAGRKEISCSKWKQLYRGIGNWLTTKDKYYLSAHYLIGRNGELTRMVNPDTHVAYHAGKSSFWNPRARKWMKGCNDYFIGIEILGDGNLHEYSEAQYKCLAKLCKALMNKYPSIQPHCITGHEVVSPGRKSDPGVKFSWRHFFQELYSQS